MRNVVLFFILLIEKNGNVQSLSIEQEDTHKQLYR